MDEARAYLAYGRPEQAREVLRRALIRDPSRSDVRAMIAALGQPAPAAAGLSIGEMLLWFALVPAVLMLPGLGIIAYAFVRGTTELAIGGITVMGLGLMAFGKVLCRLHAQGRIVVRGGFLHCPAPGELSVRLGAWWTEPGFFLGFGIWILGLYTRQWWLLPVGLACLVVVVLAAGRFSARDPASRAARLLMAGRKAQARALAQGALARNPGDAKLRALIEILDKDEQRP